MECIEYEYNALPHENVDIESFNEKLLDRTMFGGFYLITPAIAEYTVCEEDMKANKIGYVVIIDPDEKHVFVQIDSLNTRDRYPPDKYIVEPYAIYYGETEDGKMITYSVIGFILVEKE